MFKTPKGTNDVLPEKKIISQKIVDLIKETFEVYGFNPLETPALERYEVLASKYAGGAEILKETFSLEDRGGRKLGLRYDLTVPLCRVTAANPQLARPFKRYQIGRVWRDGPVKLGRYREFWQADVDVIGPRSQLADAEILSITSDIFKKLNLDVVIKVNNRKVLAGLLDSVRIKKEKQLDVMLSIDKLAKIGPDGVKDELLLKGLDKTTVDRVMEIIDIKGNNAQILSKVKKIITNKEGKRGILELEQLFNYIKIFDLKNVSLDISLARGLVFYTGTIFEVYLKEGKIKSSLAGGGRYDKLIGAFSKKGEVPATGISFGLDVILDALSEVVKPIKSVTKVFVIPISTLKESIKVAQKLRKAGVKTDLDLMERGISKNLDFVNKQGIPYVIFVGKKELEKESVKLRDMQTGKEKLIKIKDLIKEIEKL